MPNMDRGFGFDIGLFIVVQVKLLSAMWVSGVSGCFMLLIVLVGGMSSLALLVDVVAAGRKLGVSFRCDGFDFPASAVGFPTVFLVGAIFLTGMCVYWRYLV